MALSDNLVAYWKLDESSGNASDATGNGSTLTNNGSVTYSAAKINNGASLGGAGKYFSCSDNSYISTTGDTTWQVWWYPTTLNAQQAFFDKWNYSAATREYEVFANYSGGTTTLYVNLSSNGSTASTASKTTTSISTNNWYHLVYVYTASTGTVEFFLNGSSLGTSTGNLTSIYNSTSTLGIGQYITGGGGNISGMLDELGMWKRALSSTEVTELYNSGNGLAYPFTATAKPSTLMMMGCGT
jgi:hypothetical protein